MPDANWLQERRVTPGVKTWTLQQDEILPDQTHTWPHQRGVRGRQPSQQRDSGGQSTAMIQPENHRDRSEVDEERTTTGGAAPFDTDLSSLERTVPGVARSVDGRMQLTSPQTVCHVRVTVRQRSPGQTDSVLDAAPAVPALRRAGIPSKRSSPARRRVTFSEQPPNVDDRRPMFVAQQHHQKTAGEAALDTLWHYHETYPWMESRHVGQTQKNLDLSPPAFRVSSPDGPLPRNDNENENSQQRDDVATSRVDRLTTREQSGEVSDHRASCSAARDDHHDDDLDYHQQQQQHHHQGSRDDDTEQSEETSLSIKQLVASFESMSSPFMRAPLIARSEL